MDDEKVYLVEPVPEGSEARCPAGCLSMIVVVILLVVVL